MYPHLLNLPIYIIALIGGGLLSASAAGNAKKNWIIIVASIAGAALGFGIAYSQNWGHQLLPVQGYGVMILLGFLCGVWMAYRRAPLMKVDPKHCVDIGVLGVIIGLGGARLLHIFMYWPQFNPLQHGMSGVVDMFKIWEGGLTFYGAFVLVIPWTWWYCRRHGIPGVPFIDLAVPSLIAGQAFGRIGCFLNGCCYGKQCGFPWAVHFPPGSPPYIWQMKADYLAENASSSLPIHPTQIYAAIAGALTAAFLYAYWPYRKYDGQILSLTLIMAGSTRFFEELLRADEPALIAAVPQFSIAHWMALAIAATGFALLLYFRKRRTLYEA